MILQIIVVISLLWAGCAGRGEISEEKAQLLSSVAEDRSLEQTTLERDVLNREIPEDRGTLNRDIPEPDSLQEWTGYYFSWGKMSTGTSVTMDFWIYEEDGQYYGYLVLNGWETEGENAFRHQYKGILAEIHEKEDGLEVCCLQEFPGETKEESLFPLLEVGETLFVLHGGAEEIPTDWLALEMSERDTRCFARQDSVLSAIMVTEEQVEQFLRAEGISADEKPWFSYEPDGVDRLRFWFDPERGKGVGTYDTFYPDEETGSIAGFGMDSGDIVQEVWVDRKYSVTKAGEEDYMPEAAEETWEYNEAGRPVRYLLEGADPWEELSDKQKIIEITFTYREDGTLAQKDCYYNHRAFGTMRMSETSIYDASERILYTHSYVTHGGMEDYYIYDGDAGTPSYCLILDYQGLDVSVAGFVEYVEDEGGAPAVP
ncbi:MAG: hypothetical protein NC079_10595 [Clostridium sp.]|nr:hypothetical protein [Clostridium sp.]